MSTVANLISALGPRIDSSNETYLIPIINMAIRTIAKRLFVLRSELLRESMEVKIFASVETWELMTLDVAPATAWEVGDTIEGLTSGETCYVEEVSSTTEFYASHRSGTFTLGEILTNGTYQADQGAANPTFASAMVVVDGGDGLADTITYVAAKFVDEGFQADMPITTTEASNAGPLKLVTVETDTLTLEADVATAALSSDFIITSVDTFGYLPSDFWGLIDEPHIDGKTYPLKPLPSKSVELQYQSPGEPIYYQIKGNKRMYVTPGTAADYTIKADYWKRPTAITATTDTVPFNELFDDAICEAIMMFYRKGADEERRNIEFYIRRAVDLVAVHYGRVAPKTASQDINWGRLIEE